MNPDFFTPQNFQKSAEHFRARLQEAFPVPLIAPPPPLPPGTNPGYARSFTEKSEQGEAEGVPLPVAAGGTPFLCVIGMASVTMHPLVPVIEGDAFADDLQAKARAQHSAFTESVRRNRQNIRFVVDQEKASRAFFHDGGSLREVTVRKAGVILAAHLETLRAEWLRAQPPETVARLAALAKPTLPPGSDWRAAWAGDVLRKPWEFEGNALVVAVGEKVACEVYLDGLPKELGALYEPSTVSTGAAYLSGKATAAVLHDVPQSVADCFSRETRTEELDRVAKAEFRAARGCDFGNPTVRFCDCDCRVTVQPVRNGQLMPTFRLEDAETGEPIATVTTYREDLAEEVGVGEILVKDYTENEGLAAALTRSGLFEERARYEKGGVVRMKVLDPGLRAQMGLPPARLDHARRDEARPAVSLPVYDELRAACAALGNTSRHLPELENEWEQHRNDLLRAGENMPFLHFATANGSDLWMLLPPEHGDWPKAGDKDEDMENDRRDLLNEDPVLSAVQHARINHVPVLFHHFDGQHLRVVTREEAVRIAEEHADKVEAAWEHGQSVDPYVPSPEGPASEAAKL